MGLSHLELLYLLLLLMSRCPKSLKFSSESNPCREYEVAHDPIVLSLPSDEQEADHEPTMNLVPVNQDQYKLLTVVRVRSTLPQFLSHAVNAIYAVQTLDMFACSSSLSP